MITRAYTDPLRRTDLTLYAKPHPHTSFNSGDEVLASSSGFGSYYFTLSPSLAYGIYARAGDNPASSDVWQFTFDPAEIQKPPPSITVRTSYIAPWDSFFDLPGLVADIDFMTPGFTFSDTGATTPAVLDGPIRSVKDRVNGWRFYADRSSNPTKKADHALFNGDVNGRLIAADAAALNVARNINRLYIFTLAAPAIDLAQDIANISTNGTQAWRARVYTNTSERLLAATFVGDAGAAQAALTDTGKVTGANMVITAQFLYATGTIKISKNLETPSTLSLSGTGATPDVASVVWAVGGSTSTTPANVVSGPIYRQWYLSPSSDLSDSQINTIIQKMAELKGLSI